MEPAFVAVDQLERMYKTQVDRTLIIQFVLKFKKKIMEKLTK